MPNDDLIGYRLSRAFTTLEEARLLFEHDAYAAVANRLYYAAFYAANALLASAGLEAKTHRGVKNLFYQEFIAKQILEKQLSDTYQNLIDLRTDSDYGDFVEVGRADVEALVGSTENFLKAIKEHLKK